MNSRPASENPAKVCYIPRMPSGFSLAEMLAAMTIGAMVLVAVLTIYSSAERSAAAVTGRLDVSRTPREILQRIAEDIDRIISSGSGAQITILNKHDHLLPTAKMTISRTYKDRTDREQKFEEIIWQTSYDFESFGDGLVLYRSHSGIAAEDKLLESAYGKQTAQRYRKTGITRTATYWISLFKRAQQKVENQHYRSRRILMYNEKMLAKSQREMGLDPILDNFD